MMEALAAATLRHGVDQMLTVVDLFAGCGGLTQGFHLTGRFRTVGAVEFDHAAASTYAANFGSDNVHQGDIKDWVKRDDLPAAHLVIGGPPCQGFSTLGKRELADPRNLLWREYMNALVKIKPKVFVLENVPQFKTSEQFLNLMNSMSPTGALRDYRLDHRVVYATNFGAAQLRKRLIIIGTHRDFDRILVPTGTIERENWTTVEARIGDLQGSIDPGRVSLPETTTQYFDRDVPGEFKASDLDFGRNYSKISHERMRAIKAEGDRSSIPEALLPKCWKGRKAGMDVYGRLRWNKPSVTIRTEFFKPEKGRYLHPEENRALSHHEAARLQGFDDTYVWCGTKVEIARQIGNAVPVELANGLATHIAKKLSGTA
jgi:DNA (cytosine-5)-methyltransferase 1